MYYSLCISCHAKGTYAGPSFKKNWNNRPLWDLWDWISNKMPKNDPGSLTPPKWCRSWRTSSSRTRCRRVPRRCGRTKKRCTTSRFRSSRADAGASAPEAEGDDSWVHVIQRGWAGSADCFSLIAILTLPSLGARQQTLVRGNAPGEWRYWGADAWSTRYSPLDQINALELQLPPGRMALERGRRRPRRVLPDDAALCERPAVHGGDHASLRVRGRSREGHDALELEARGRHPVAEGAASVRRPRPRLLDRRPRQRAHRRRDARVPHGDS